MSFEDKVAIVTGASSGIGAAVAIALSAEGASVVIVGRNHAKLSNTASKCTDALVIQGDVTDDEEARAIIQKTVERFGKIDILVNNAGGLIMANITDENIMEAFDYTMKVNVRAVFRLTSLAVPYLIKTKGNIVNISSVGGCSTVLFSEVISYSVSKAALSHFGACLAADLASHGVRVNTIAPGPVSTDILENIDFPGSWDDFKGLTALGRVTESKEIADLVLFVAGDKGKSMTGTNLVCDNGWAIKRS